MSTMSSSSMTRLPFTSPMIFMTSEMLAFWRRLSTPEGHVQLLRKGAGAGPRCRRRGDDHEVLIAVAELLEIVVAEDGRAEEVVHGDVEEALYLGGVEVHGEDAVGAGGGDEVGHQLGGDGVAALGLAVLPGVAEIVGDNGGDAAGGGPLEGVDHHQNSMRLSLTGEQVD